MAKLIYIGITSPNGYIEEEAGRFDWAMPDEEAHNFVNHLVRPVGTHLYRAQKVFNHTSARRRLKLF